jgi:predicted RNA-binding protein with PUA domain
MDGPTKRKKVEGARKLIYGKKNYAVDADKVEELLKPTSLVPAKVCSLLNTF